jgi:hypothetical protein
MPDSATYQCKDIAAERRALRHIACGSKRRTRRVAGLPSHQRKLSGERGISRGRRTIKEETGRVDGLIHQLMNICAFWRRDHDSARPI